MLLWWSSLVCSTEGTRMPASRSPVTGLHLQLQPTYKNLPYTYRPSLPTLRATPQGKIFQHGGGSEWQHRTIPEPQQATHREWTEMIKVVLAGRLQSSHLIAHGQVQQPASGVLESNAFLSQKVPVWSIQVPRGLCVCLESQRTKTTCCLWLLVSRNNSSLLSECCMEGIAGEKKQQQKKHTQKHRKPIAAQ